MLPWQAKSSSTCNADSSGRLFLRDGNVIRVAGITSGGLKPDCLHGDHSYDTDVFAWHKWIDRFEADTSETAQGDYLVFDVDSGVLGQTFTLHKEKETVLIHVETPAGLAALRVAMNGEDDGTGRNDFNLFLISGRSPDPAKAVCRREGSGQFAFCEVKQPARGPWTILLSREKGRGLAQVVVTLLRYRDT